MITLLVSSPQGLVARRSLLRFAAHFDYSAPEIRCDLRSPITRLAQLLDMNPVDYVAVEGAELPAPVWDENKFMASRLERPCHLQFWKELILPNHPDRERLLEAMRGMKPQRYFRRFRGRFAGVSYDCDSPPPRVFRNNFSTEPTFTGLDPEAWALSKILEDEATGAVIRLGKVGVVPPPRVVLPLSVEPAKPRLIHDARYTNLWCESRLFVMDRVGSVPEKLQQGAFMVSYDHKSGYHAFPFHADAREWFGFEIGGSYFVPAAGIFGWNCIPEIYNVSHDALVDFARRVFGIPGMCYLDDVLSGSSWNVPRKGMEPSAGWAIELLLWLNFLAGYTISVKKSVLKPVQIICWLGINIDSILQIFSVPAAKKEIFMVLVRDALRSGTVSIRNLERMAGKAVSFMLAVGEAAKVFTREMFNVLRDTRSRRSSKLLRVSARLKRVLHVWSKFLDTFDGAPWLRIMHSVLRIETDASSRRWGGVLQDGDTTLLEVGEEFSSDEMALHIEAKEAIAVSKVIEGIVAVKGWDFLKGRRIDAWIDNMPLVFAMAKGSSKMKEVHDTVEKLFWWKLEHHFTLAGLWWSTHKNFRADGITRTELDSDWRLNNSVFLQLWAAWGPFDMDLMASSISVQNRPDGSELPFFSRYISPRCAGVNLLAQKLKGGTFYCFPPSALIEPVISHLPSSNVSAKLILVATMERSGAWAPRAHGLVIEHAVLPKGCVVDHMNVAVDRLFGCWVFDTRKL